MCLAIPVRVVELAADDNAVVDLGGIRKQISLALVDGVQVGDFVILHVGYALTKLDPEEAEKTLALFREAGLPIEASEDSALADGPVEERAA
jgi:hydrogenase expression/formation protein HypC